MQVFYTYTTQLVPSEEEGQPHLTASVADTAYILLRTIKKEAGQ